MPIYNTKLELASATGSNGKEFTLNEPYDNLYNLDIPLASSTGSKGKNFTSLEPLYKVYESDFGSMNFNTDIYGTDVDSSTLNWVHGSIAVNNPVCYWW